MSANEHLHMSYRSFHFWNSDQLFYIIDFNRSDTLVTSLGLWFRLKNKTKITIHSYPFLCAKKFELRNFNEHYIELFSNHRKVLLIYYACSFKYINLIVSCSNFQLLFSSYGFKIRNQSSIFYMSPTRSLCHLSLIFNTNLCSRSLCKRLCVMVVSCFANI